MTIETRHTSGVVALRSDGDKPVLGGYALKFNRLSQNLGGFVERVAPGAVTKTMRDGGDVLARFQHLDEYLLGRTASGSLRLSVDETGLLYEVDLPDTGYARDLAALATRGDVQHSSFAFRTIADEWGFTEQGFPLRTLVEIQLVDVAPVVNPAYLDTTSGLRTLAEARGLDVDAVATAARGVTSRTSSQSPRTSARGSRAKPTPTSRFGGDAPSCCSVAPPERPGDPHHSTPHPAGSP